MVEVSVVVPTYCEAGNIGALLDALRAALPSAELIVVDDASPDDTAGVVRRRAAGDPALVLLVRDRDRGLGRSVGAGLAQARGAVVVVLDADFNHDPADVPRLLARLDEGGLELVVGSRFVRGGGMDDRRRYWLSALFSGWVGALLGTGVRENLSGFFAARASAIASLEAGEIFFGYGDYFFRLLDAARRRGMRVGEVPVVYGARRAGRSKTRFLPVLVRYTAAALRQRFRVHTK